LRGSSIIPGGEKGQAVILVVIAMGVLLIGALGLALDGGQMYAHRQMAQAAADAAAQAGIMSIFRGTNATSSYPFGTGTPPIASTTCTTTDGRTPCVYARNNGFGGTASDTVTLSFPATVTGVTLSSATVPAFSVSVQRTLQTGLIRFLGASSTSSIVAKATAGMVGTVSSDCIYVLNPAAQNAFLANNGAAVSVSGCAIAVNSSSSQGASISGGASVTAPALDIVGGCSCTGTYPTLATGVAAIADPFASLPAPTPASCAAHPTMYSPGSGTTLSPGTYCGGITVSNGATNVVFSAGTYIIEGGGVTFGGGATASGSNVMFFLSGTNTTYASVTIANGVSVTLSGPVSGVYMGVLFFQDRTITSSSNATFAGGATMMLTGSLYFPTTDVSFSNGTSAVGYSTAIVANEVSFAGGATIKYDPTGLKTGLFSQSVALIQ
jgi:hypothetical protein